jgi:5-(carboxyamino)imidazole ribonucleotide synthase
MNMIIPGVEGVEGQPLMLGVTGGGQLARMFVHAAQSLGFRTAVLDPDPCSPAGLVSHLHLLAPYDDEAALAQMSHACIAVTTEFENVPAATLRALAGQVHVAPDADAVEICQYRVAEKRHFTSAGVPCAPYTLIETDDDLHSVDIVLLPGILKTARLGYDGKGQTGVAAPADVGTAWALLRRAPCVLEKRLPLHRELSVIVARGADDQIVHLPVQQNLHRDGILAITQVPAPDIPKDLAAQAVQHAGQLARSMNYVGVLCVEFFLLSDGALVANEMAPRPHNSGHYSLDACDISQFDLQVRTMAGLPLVAPRLHSAAVMINLLGDLWFPDRSSTAVTPDWPAILALPGAHLHLYGKAEARPGRKMGHLTITGAHATEVREVALRACARLGLPGF